MLTMKEPVIESAPLTALDRCDACGAAALVRVHMKATGLELLFCGHHMKKNQAALTEIADFDPNWESNISF